MPVMCLPSPCVWGSPKPICFLSKHTIARPNLTVCVTTSTLSVRTTAPMASAQYLLNFSAAFGSTAYQLFLVFLIELPVLQQTYIKATGIDAQENEASERFVGHRGNCLLLPVPLAARAPLPTLSLPDVHWSFAYLP